MTGGLVTCGTFTGGGAFTFVGAFLGGATATDCGAFRAGPVFGGGGATGLGGTTRDTRAARLPAVFDGGATPGGGGTAGLFAAILAFDADDSARGAAVLRIPPADAMARGGAAGLAFEAAAFGRAGTVGAATFGAGGGVVRRGAGLRAGGCGRVPVEAMAGAFSLSPPGGSVRVERGIFAGGGRSATGGLEDPSSGTLVTGALGLGAVCRNSPGRFGGGPNLSSTERSTTTLGLPYMSV